MKRIYLAGFIVCLGLAGLIQACGSGSSSSGGGDNTDINSSDTLGAASAAAFGGMGGNGNINQEAGLPGRLLDFLMRQAIAQAEDFTACDAVSGGEGPDGIIMSLDGTDGTYGVPTDELPVASGGEFSFCADGGDVAAWSISSSSPVSMTCTDSSNNESATVTMSGSGVFREGTDDSDNDVTLVRGTFLLSVTGGDSVTATCSWDITHSSDTDIGGDFSGGCEDADGNAITNISETFSCTDPS